MIDLKNDKASRGVLKNEIIEGFNEFPANEEKGFRRKKFTNDLYWLDCGSSGQKFVVWDNMTDEQWSEMLEHYTLIMINIKNNQNKFKEDLIKLEALEVEGYGLMEFNEEGISYGECGFMEEEWDELHRGTWTLMWEAYQKKLERIKQDDYQKMINELIEIEKVEHKKYKVSMEFNEEGLKYIDDMHKPQEIEFYEWVKMSDLPGTYETIKKDFKIVNKLNNENNVEK